MPPDLSADEVRSRSFPGALRGYDRDAVDRFRDEVADRLAELESRLADVEARLSQLGIHDLPDLTAEITRVGADLETIMAEAVRAASELRARATQDAEQWRAQAETDAAAVRSEAEADAAALRGSVWELASEMLTDSSDEVERMMRAAQDDALFIRAEAEREELRAVAEARRAAEDLLRSARSDGEQIVAGAHAESEQILESARRSAEAAQERARALEDRRSELMRELEATRKSIDELENQMEERTAPAAEPAERPVAYPEDPSVRIVPARDVIVPGVVDADEMAAEVEEMRRIVPPAAGSQAEAVNEAAPQVPAPEPTPEAVDTPVEVSREPEVLDDDIYGEGSVRVISAKPAAPPEDAPPEDAAAPLPETAPAESAGEASPEATPATTAPSAASESAGEASAEATPAAMAPSAASEAEPEEPAVGSEPEPAVPTPAEPVASNAAAHARIASNGAGRAEPISARPAAIEDLFASLRSAPEDDRSPAPTVPNDAEDAPRSQAPQEEPAASQPEPAEPEAAPVSERSMRPASSMRAAVDLRDRMLLPLQNSALRDLKRSILDLQNEVLEAIRVSEGRWTPEQQLFAGAVTPAVHALAVAAYAAGSAAAAELADSDAAPAVVGAPSEHGLEVAAALRSAVSDGLSRAEARSAGQRELAAAVSRVFRAWRTDEAERRARMVAFRAYHEGVLAGFASLGVDEVIAVTEGRQCAECPAVPGASWDPSGALPEGMLMPPAHPECVTTIVPAAGVVMAGSGG